MLKQTSYPDLYIGTLGVMVTLPVGGTIAGFECYDYDVYTSAAAIANLIWKMHTLSPVRFLSGVINPLLDKTSANDLAPVWRQDQICAFAIDVLRLGDVRSLLEKNRAYGNWTLLGTQRENENPLNIAKTKSLEPFVFGVEVDIDCGMRGFGPRQILDTDDSVKAPVPYHTLSAQNRIKPRQA